MNKYLFSLTLASGLLCVSVVALAQDAAPGESYFKQNCATCHTIGKGKLVGPDLANILQRRPEEWVLKFVKSSQTVIKSGDKYADSLFQAFNQMIMPDQPTATGEVVKNIIAYINISGKNPGPTAKAPATTSPQTDQQTGKASGSFFTTTNVILFSAIFIMLLVIVFLARVNKSLVEQIRDYYSSNKSFF